MKRGVMVGRAVLPEMADWVVVGLGDRTVDWLLSLYNLMFCYLRDCMEVDSHSLLDRSVETAVLVVDIWLLTLPIWLLSWVNPPQLLARSPLRATSRAR